MSRNRKEQTAELCVMLRQPLRVVATPWERFKPAALDLYAMMPLGCRPCHGPVNLQLTSCKHAVITNQLWYQQKLHVHALLCKPINNPCPLQQTIMALLIQTATEEPQEILSQSMYLVEITGRWFNQPWAWGSSPHGGSESGCCKLHHQ